MASTSIGDLIPPPRVLLGPGPSLVHPRVLRALSMPIIGHLDPAFLTLLDETQVLLRRVFHTNNRYTLALSGTGSAGMEAVLVNVIEPGDVVVVGVNGLFGTRLVAMVERCGGKPLLVEAPWGHPIDLQVLREVMSRSAPVKAVAVVHAETSTGVRQDLEPIGRLCREAGTLFIVDAVTSLAGIPLEVDAWQIDACYSGTQKCLSCPPGLSPITLSERALAVIRRRRTACRSWYLDFSLIAGYWEEQQRLYHHTAPISMIFALRESLRLVLEEGLPARVARHELHSRALLAGLEALAIRPLPAPDVRLPMLNCVSVPPELDEAAVRTELLDRFGIEIGGGLGVLKGRVWRIGLMGESATAGNVLMLLNALGAILARRRWTERPEAAPAAAAAIYAKTGMVDGVTP
ncbi:MAG: alanine--glyoxylate aminotransferase family protein [Nitrospiraceae bacterium]